MSLQPVIPAGPAKYLVVYKGLNAIPDHLRKFVKKSLTEEYKPFNVELDFSGTRTAKDLEMTFTSDMPTNPVYGESERDTNTTGATTTFYKGVGWVYVRAMQLTRIETGSDTCDMVFADNEDDLGGIIVYVAVHETAHMLGLNTGGFEDAGHSTDPANWMWSPSSLPKPVGPVRPWSFDYTVKTGDTLGMIVMRYIHGTLDECHVGASDLTVSAVWDHPRNKTPGFIADPNKGKISGRRANDPSFIYAGEKVALFNYNVKAPSFRSTASFYTRKKSFTDEQKAIINKFISDRMLIVK